MLNRFLTTLLLPALFLCPSTLLAQDDSGDPEVNMVPLYSEQVLSKTLKISADENEEYVYPKGLLAMDGMPWVLSYRGTRNAETSHFVLSASKDGKNWRFGKMAPFPVLYGPNVAAAYLPSQKGAVLFYGGESPSLSNQDEFTPGLFYVSLAKRLKLSKPKDVSKNFKPAKGAVPDLPGSFDPLFRGTTLSKGEHAGRIIFLYEDHTSNQIVRSLYSDNNGKSWKIGQPANLEQLSRVMTLNDIAEADNGQLVSFLPSSARLNWLISDDGGTSWRMQTGSALRDFYPKVLLVLNTADGQGTDSRLLAFDGTQVRLSYDWGKTWPHAKNFPHRLNNTQTSGQVCVLKPGVIGVLVVASEGGGRFQISPSDYQYTSFTLSWLTDGKDDGTKKVEAAAGE